MPFAIPTEANPKYISGVADQNFHFQAMMSVLSDMRSVGTPLGIDIDNQPWVSSTVWRTVSDSTNRVVRFASATTPATFWVKLDDLDLKPGAPVKNWNWSAERPTAGMLRTSSSRPSCSTSRRSGAHTKQQRSSPPNSGGSPIPVVNAR